MSSGPLNYRTWCTLAPLTRRPLGLRATRRLLGGGYIVAPLHICVDNVATRSDREAKLCTHIPEYIAKIVSKFSVDPIENDAQ